jgi:hypothetical protein
LGGTPFSQLPAKSAFRKEDTQNLPLTGGKGAVLILFLSLVIVLMSAAEMALAKKRMKKGKTSRAARQKSGRLL